MQNKLIDNKIKFIILSVIISIIFSLFLICPLVACSGNVGSTQNFKIEGKWKSVGDWGVGQAQPGSIVTFDRKNCNLVSPSDTYAFYKEGNGYILDATTALFSQNSSFNVKVIDNNNIELSSGSDSNITKLKRVG